MTSNRTLGEAIDFYRSLTLVSSGVNRSFYLKRLDHLERLLLKLNFMFIFTPS